MKPYVGHLARITCRICEGMFSPSHPSTRLCSPRCVYISDRLKSRPAKQMTREDAVQYYGDLFDDPLRLYQHSRHASVLQHIYDFCKENKRDTFTCAELNVDSPIRITHQKLAQIRKKFNVLEKCADPTIHWKFSLPDPEECK